MGAESDDWCSGLNDDEDRDMTWLEEEHQEPTGDPSCEESPTPILDSHEEQKDRNVDKNDAIWEGEKMGGATGDNNFGEAAVACPSGMG